MPAVRIANPREGEATHTSLTRARRYVQRGHAEFVNSHEIRFLDSRKPVQIVRLHAARAAVRNLEAELQYDRVNRTMRPDELKRIPFTGDTYRLLQLRTRS